MVKARLQNYFFVSIGIVGMVVLLFGLLYGPTQISYVIGSALLLLTALHFKLTFFMGLELILIAGHGGILLNFNNSLQIALPILLSFQLMFYYLLSGQLTSIFLLIGILGIAFLSIGFAHENQWIFFFGGLSIAVYSFYTAYQGQRVTLLWAILNSLFALIAIYQLIFDPF